MYGRGEAASTEKLEQFNNYCTIAQKKIEKIGQISREIIIEFTLFVL
jgi:hypothetical protein